MILLVSFISISFILVFFPLILNLKFIKTCSPEAGRSTEKSARLGFLYTLRLLSTLIFNRDTPNYEVSADLHKRNGKVMIIDLIMARQKRALISIADLTIAKQITNSFTWLNRIPDDHYLHKPTFNKETGVLFGSGEGWKQARALSIKLLHQLDFYKVDKLEELIMTEVEDFQNKLYQRIENNGGEVTLCPHHMFEIHTVNIVSQVLMSRRFNPEDPILHALVNTWNDFNRQFNLGYSVLEVFPWLRHIPWLTYYGTYVKTNKAYNDVFGTIIRERRQRGNYRANPQDFIDQFMVEIDRRADETPNYINDECLMITLRDMVWAGSDTSNSTMEHAVMHLALNPEVQTKAQHEIDEVIGVHRAAKYNDRHEMPYMQALIMEILRHATPVPMVSRAPVTDTVIDNDQVTKGSLLGINLYAIHRSEELWEDPLEFRPERFLGENGEIINGNKIMPFGSGKRMCLGETVGKTTLFLFVVSLLQKFNFRVSDQHPPPSLKNIAGMTRCPVPYYVKIAPRPL